MTSALNPARAIEHLMDLLAVEGLSGREGAVAKAVTKKLIAAGCKPAWIRHDQAHKKIPHDFEIGNLIVRLPGTVKAPRVMFASHLDTVPLCRGAKPVRKGMRITSAGDTALGGDNRTAVACMVTLVETLLRDKIPHPPLTLLFTVGEEIGLWGARFVKAEDLSHPVMGFNYDSGDPAEICVGAIGADRWEVDVRGLSSHAGVHPEHGVSAALIAARAITDFAAGGWFGKIVKGRNSGTSNVGIVQGGEATNQVTDHVYIKGESRSHKAAFVGRITGEIEKAFQRAAKSVRNHEGVCGKIEFRKRREYDSFRMDAKSPPVRIAAAAAKDMGLTPDLKVTNGGLDANFFNAHGVPTVTLGAGQHNPHTVAEYVDLEEFVKGCELALRITAACAARG